MIDLYITDCQSAQWLLLTALQKRGIETRPLVIHRTPYGKPYLCDFPQIGYSVSHSGAYTLLAIGETPIGADIQQHRGNKDALAKRFYADKENAVLRELKEPERTRRFYDIWARKESYIKCRGKGLHIALNSFSIQCDCDTQEACPMCLRTVNQVAYYFRCFSNFADQGYSIAVCAHQPIPSRITMLR